MSTTEQIARAFARYQNQSSKHLPRTATASSGSAKQSAALVVETDDKCPYCGAGPDAMDRVDAVGIPSWHCVPCRNVFPISNDKIA